MIIRFFYLVCIILFSTQCKNFHKKKSPSSYQQIRWSILTFEDTVKHFQKHDWLWLDAEFVTQDDSVFWNSHHEGADKFLIQLRDSTESAFFFPFYISSEKDSLMILAPKEIILRDIFKVSECPYFLKNDSIIRCFIKIKRHFLSLEGSIFQMFQQDELKLIENFLIKNKPLYQKDSNDIIWLEPLPIPAYKARPDVKEVTVAYSGYFLDGRMIDHNDSLGIRYNDTLQLIEGLNYVIKKLNVGQSAKIILPSRLAFRERGSFNKTIPPFSPLLYEIKLMQIQ